MPRHRRRCRRRSLLGACGSRHPTPGRAPTTFPASPTPAAGPRPVPARHRPRHRASARSSRCPAASPELCLGPVMESYPPQCDGVPLAGWDWEEHRAARGGRRPRRPCDPLGHLRRHRHLRRPHHDRHRRGAARPVRHGGRAVATTPGAARPHAPTSGPTSSPASACCPGMLTSVREGDIGPVYVDVVHDDGTLQAWADATFGAGAVRVTSALR